MTKFIPTFRAPSGFEGGITEVQADKPPRNPVRVERWRDLRIVGAEGQTVNVAVEGTDAYTGFERIPAGTKRTLKVPVNIEATDASVSVTRGKKAA